MGQPFRRGLVAGVLAEEILFLECRQARVTVGCSGKAEFIRVGSKLFFQQEPVLERLARIFAGEHVVGLGGGQVQVSRIPVVVIGELVVGRQEWVRFTVTLDLGDFVKRLPLGALLDIVLVQRLAGKLLVHREHDAVGEVAVMRQREHSTIGLFLVGLHPVVKVERIRASEWRRHGERNDLPCPFGAVPENHVAVQIVALIERGPLETDQRREGVPAH